MQVRHEAAEDFLNLIKEWEKLCQSILSSEVNGSVKEDDSLEDMEDSEENDEGDAGEEDSEVYEVDEILDICYGNPNNKKKPELHFKVSCHLFCSAEFYTCELSCARGASF